MDCPFRLLLDMIHLHSQHISGQQHCAPTNWSPSLRLATVHETQPLSSPGCLLQVLLGNQGSAVALSCKLPASTVTQYVVVIAQLPATNISASELLCLERDAVASVFASSVESHCICVLCAKVCSSTG